jgi:hypothetical protein
MTAHESRVFCLYRLVDFSHDGGSDRLMMHLKDEEIAAVESKKLRARIIK